MTPGLVERAHDEELAVNTWTCNEPDRIRWLAGEAGVDGIVTDVPDVALAALGRRPPLTPTRGGRRTPPWLPATRRTSGQDQVQDLGLVAELELLGVTQVVAVDLVGDRPVRPHAQRR